MARMGDIKVKFDLGDLSELVRVHCAQVGCRYHVPADVSDTCALGHCDLKRITLFANGCDLSPRCASWEPRHRCQDSDSHK